MKENFYTQFPGLKRYSKLYNISEESLVEGFKLESHYHDLLLDEKDFKRRDALYSEFYTKLMRVYEREKGADIDSNQKVNLVRLFEKEIKNKSIVDFGCGQAYMLLAIKKLYGNKSLNGVDVFIPNDLKTNESISFEEQSIIRYQSNKKFDVAFSDNVIEHLVREDALEHIKAVYKSLEPNGKFILMMPNRLFSPADVTRILDFSASGKTQAQGGHVNESTYHEMAEVLKSVGFKKLRTILPIPKLKYTLFRRTRTSLAWVYMIERSPLLLRFFQILRVNGECPIKFNITIIAEK